MTQTPTEPIYPAPPPWPKRKKHTKLKIAGGVVAAGALVGIGAAIGSAGSSTVPVPGPTVTGQAVPGPTVTQTVAPPPPAAGTLLATFKGSGTETTPAFNVPSSGDYVVSWTFSGNDSQGTGGDNFIMSATSQDVEAMSLPNDIASAGHGSTEITGDSGTDSFNVQADDTASWTVKVVSAS